ncbi:LysR family transcriptional regulator [Amycolatopsis jejuensis]|uniref:LysR family transcriptional regulator n=1 Tax=Amycolatopsis jejuensis TaxID=330084 RepID=UPI000689470D|nr:LysR family transcriptional regulator [Amycolatopsis jejuensis]
MELRQLRYFAEAARLSHFTRAAERLNVAQPALSQQIRALERELEVTLFERRGRRVLLTAAGERLLAQTEVILTEVERARAQVREVPEDPGGTTVVGALSSLVTTFLPAELPVFHRRFPQVDVAIREQTTGQMLRRLREGDLELAIGDDRLGDGSVALARRPLFTEELVVAAPPGHRFAGNGDVAPGDLPGAHFVSYQPGSGVRETLVALLRSEGHEPHIAYESSSPEQLVAHGLGVALMPRMAAEAAGGRVAVKSLRPPRFRKIALFTVRDRYLSSAGEAFWRHQWGTPPAAQG